MKGGRQCPHITGNPTLRDWTETSPEGFTFRKMPDDHVIGKKPKTFLFWLFDCIGLQPGDELIDLYPGTRAVSQSWEEYQKDYGLVRYGQRQLFANQRLNIDGAKDRATS